MLNSTSGKTNSFVSFNKLSVFLLHFHTRHRPAGPKTDNIRKVPMTATCNLKMLKLLLKMLSGDTGDHAVCYL